jgi:hypothetical protein
MARDRNAGPDDDRSDDRREDLGPNPEKFRGVARDEEEYEDAEEYDEQNPDEEDESAF